MIWSLNYDASNNLYYTKEFDVDINGNKIDDTLKSISSFEPVYSELVFGKDKRKFRRKIERKMKGKKKYGFK